MMFPRVFFAPDGSGGGAPAPAADVSSGGGNAPTGFDAGDAKLDGMSDDAFNQALATDPNAAPEGSNAANLARAVAANPAAPSKISVKLKNGSVLQMTPEELAEVYERDASRGKHWQQTAVKQVQEAERVADEKYRGLYGQKIEALQGKIGQLLERLDQGATPQGRQPDPAVQGQGQDGGEGQTVIDMLEQRLAAKMEEAVARHLTPLQETAWLAATDALENATNSYEGNREELLEDLAKQGVVFNEQGQIDPEKNSAAKVERAARRAIAQREADNQNVTQYTQWADDAAKEYPEETFDNDDRATIAGLILQAARGDKSKDIPKQPVTALLWKDLTRQVYEKNIQRAMKLASALKKQRATAAGQKADVSTLPRPAEEPEKKELGKPVNPWDEADKKLDSAQFQF